MQFIDSLHLTCGIWLRGNQGKIVLPHGFAQYFQQLGQIVFILVIKNCPIDELPHIEEALEIHLKKERLIWNLQIRAYNEEIATNKNLVITKDNKLETKLETKPEILQPDKL